jgi:hypothetical protein
VTCVTGVNDIDSEAFVHLLLVGTPVAQPMSRIAAGGGRKQRRGTDPRQEREFHETQESRAASILPRQGPLLATSKTSVAPSVARLGNSWTRRSSPKKPGCWTPS